MESRSLGTADGGGNPHANTETRDIRAKRTYEFPEPPKIRIPMTVLRLFGRQRTEMSGPPEKRGNFLTRRRRSSLPRWSKKPFGPAATRSRGDRGAFRIFSRDDFGRYSLREIDFSRGNSWGEFPGPIFSANRDSPASFRGRPILGRVPTEGRFGSSPPGWI